MIIAFCGHSNYISNFEDEKRVLKLLDVICQGKQVNFYLGGYGNFDNFALNCAIKYKENNKSAKIVFITPYIDEWLNNRKEIIENYYDEIVFPEIERVPKKFAILKRNEWIITQADFILFYVNNHYGGAYRMLLYAHRQHKSYINLYKGKFELY